jgi:hypothetical protein
MLGDARCSIHSHGRPIVNNTTLSKGLASNCLLHRFNWTVHTASEKIKHQRMLLFHSTVRRRAIMSEVLCELIQGIRPYIESSQEMCLFNTLQHFPNAQQL